jgi:hypothetical protein
MVSRPLGAVNTLIRLSTPRKSLSVRTFIDAALVAPRLCAETTFAVTAWRSPASAAATAVTARATRTVSAAVTRTFIRVP